jgi:hypothetical protein
MPSVRISLAGAEVAKWAARQGRPSLKEWRPYAEGVYIVAMNTPIVRYLDDELGLPTLAAESEVEFEVVDPVTTCTASSAVSAVVSALAVLRDATDGLPERAERMLITAESR